MRKFLDKTFGGLNMSWKNLIIFAVIMGIYTATKKEIILSALDIFK